MLKELLLLKHSKNYFWVSHTFISQSKQSQASNECKVNVSFHAGTGHQRRSSASRRSTSPSCAIPRPTTSAFSRLIGWSSSGCAPISAASPSPTRATSAATTAPATAPTTTDRAASGRDLHPGTWKFPRTKSSTTST